MVGGWVVFGWWVWVCKPILVFSFCFNQAEQFHFLAFLRLVTTFSRNTIVVLWFVCARSYPPIYDQNIISCFIILVLHVQTPGYDSPYPTRTQGSQDS